MDDESASSVTPAVAVRPLDLGPVATSTSEAVDSFKSQLISLLGIPAHLVAGSRDASLPVAYLKFKAFLLACHTLEGMVGKGTRTIRKPTRTDLIELFVSKSFIILIIDQTLQKLPIILRWCNGWKDHQIWWLLMFGEFRRRVTHFLI